MYAKQDYMAESLLDIYSHNNPSRIKTNCHLLYIPRSYDFMPVSKPQNPTSLCEKQGLDIQFMVPPQLGFVGQIEN